MNNFLLPATNSPVIKEDCIKAMTIKELAAVYDVSRFTFNKWIQPFHDQIGEKVGWFYKPSQVKIIYQLLGEPG